MNFPLSFWDASLWLAVTAIILLATSELLSPYYGKTKDARLLFQRHPSNLTLSIPVLTVLLPTFLSFPLSVPLALIIPHLTYLTLFTLSTVIDFKAYLDEKLRR